MSYVYDTQYTPVLQLLVKPGPSSPPPGLPGYLFILREKIYWILDLTFCACTPCTVWIGHPVFYDPFKDKPCVIQEERKTLGS
jgi:hypothetical protein